MRDKKRHSCFIVRDSLSDKVVTTATVNMESIGASPNDACVSSKGLSLILFISRESLGDHRL